MADCEATADFKKACPFVSQEQCLSCSDAKITESDCEENRHRWSLFVGAKKENTETKDNNNKRPLTWESISNHLLLRDSAWWMRIYQIQIVSPNIFLYVR